MMDQVEYPEEDEHRDTVKTVYTEDGQDPHDEVDDVAGTNEESKKD